MANRTQKLVLSFFALAWVSLVAPLAWAPETYDQAPRLPGASHRLAEPSFLGANLGLHSPACDRSAKTLALGVLADCDSLSPRLHSA